jgi:hypothetical protein
MRCSVKHLDRCGFVWLQSDAGICRNGATRAARVLRGAAVVTAALFSCIVVAHAQVDIPLQLLGFNPATGSLEPASGLGSNKAQYYRLGINVGIGGGAPQTYLFDTGSSAFNAALAPTAMPTQTLTNLTKGLAYTYASGGGYILNQVAVPNLSFYVSPGSPQPTYTLPSVSSVTRSISSRSRSGPAPISNPPRQRPRAPWRTRPPAELDISTTPASFRTL